MGNSVVNWSNHWRRGRRSHRRDCRRNCGLGAKEAGGVMIIEGFLTTISADGTVNIAPMGPIVDEDWRRLLFRPFQSSQTFANLRRTGRGVFHVTDDVE